MITTKINVKPYLAEYIRGKFNDNNPGAVRVPDSYDLYMLIYDLMAVRPNGTTADKGNLEIILPHRSTGKSPSTYNYLSNRASDIISRKIQAMMWADLHDFLDENKHMQGINYCESVYVFASRYGITSISPDALIKNYYRWRGKCRLKQRKRKYNKNI